MITFADVQAAAGRIAGHVLRTPSIPSHAVSLATGADVTLKLENLQRIGSFKERADMERWLNDWIMNYVDGNPATSSDEVKARRPLAAAQVEVAEVEGNPGYYTSKFFLRPHYQLEGLTVSLRLVSKLPSQKTA